MPLNRDNSVLAMTADIYHNRVYWVQDYQLHSCSQDGDECFVVIGQTGIDMTTSIEINTHLNQVSDLIVTHRHVFWFVSKLGEVFKLKKFGGGKVVHRIASSLNQQEFLQLFAIQINNPDTITIPEDQDSMIFYTFLCYY